MPTKKPPVSLIEAREAAIKEWRDGSWRTSSWGNDTVFAGRLYKQARPKRMEEFVAYRVKQAEAREDRG